MAFTARWSYSVFIFHDESGIFVPSTKPGSFSIVAAYVLSSPQYREAKEVLRRHKSRNGWPINKEFKRAQLKGNEEPYFLFLNELAAVGGILVAVGSDVSGNTSISQYQHEYADGLLTISQNGDAERQALMREHAEKIRCRVSCDHIPNRRP